MPELSCCNRDYYTACKPDNNYYLALYKKIRDPLVGISKNGWYLSQVRKGKHGLSRQRRVQNVPGHQNSTRVGLIWEESMENHRTSWKASGTGELGQAQEDTR